MTRHMLRVTCKCALYTPDGSKVLLSEYGPGDYGLPGGHIEADEMPDEAMKRELAEELGLADVVFTKRDFWMHHNGKLILGYTAVISETTQIKPQLEEISAALWVPVVDIATGKVNARSYSDFICRFQPAA